jgi:hypothetical protein
MKKLFLIFVLINLGLLVYSNIDIVLPNSQRAVLAAINPEKITVLTQQQIEALPKKSKGYNSLPATNAETPNPMVSNQSAATNSASTSNACYEWGVFSPDSLNGAQSEATSLSLQSTVKEQNPTEAKRYWVYKPPLKSAESAQVKALELKALGVEELFVVQDSKWKNAISFGVFEDEKLATNLLNQLKAKGVKDVVKGVRNQGKGHASLKFTSLTDTEVMELKKLKSKFPEADVKQVSCN